MSDSIWYKIPNGFMMEWVSSHAELIDFQSLASFTSALGDFLGLTPKEIKDNELPTEYKKLYYLALPHVLREMELKNTERSWEVIIPPNVKTKIKEEAASAKDNLAKVIRTGPPMGGGFTKNFDLATLKTLKHKNRRGPK